MAGGISLKTTDKQVDGKTRFPKRPQLCFYLICVCHLRSDLLSDLIVKASVGYFLVYKHSCVLIIFKCNFNFNFFPFQSNYVYQQRRVSHPGFTEHS
jgi:hypothetical protein